MELENFRNQIYGCQRCGWCKTAVFLDQGIEKICPIRENYDHGFWEHFFGRGRLMIARGILEGRFEVTDDLAEAMYMCTTCANCEVHCGRNYPYYVLGFLKDKNIHNTEIYEALRAYLVEKGYGPRKEHVNLINSIIENGNPWQQPKSVRVRWGKRIKAKDLSKDKARFLYFVGCTFAYDYNINSVPQDAVGLLREANVDFGILGNHEICCGSTMLRLGERKHFLKIAQENIEKWNSLKVEGVLVSCAGCYTTIKNDYPKVGKMNFKVMHVVELFDQLIDEGKFCFKKEITKRVTYHDPCHLGRKSGVYDSPRKILKSIPGVDYVEMFPTREHGFCCGGGGGVPAAFRDLAIKIGLAKIKKAEESGAEILSSACPFCYQNLTLALENTESTLAFKDLTELLADSVIRG
jgi:heterodisulfide reductase subunit D